LKLTVEKKNNNKELKSDTQFTMKISTILIYCVATIVVHSCHAGLGDIVGKAADVGKLSVNVGKGVISKVPELIPTPENL
jgi:ribosomal protein L30E